MNPLKRIVLTALFAGAGVAGSYMLLGVPNVEVLTVTMFLSGYALGVKSGIVTSTIAALLFFGMNPQGGSFPPLLIAQVIGLSIAPLMGAFFQKMKPDTITSKTMRYMLLGLTAIVATGVYDLLTNLAFPLISGLQTKAIIGFLIAGIPFSLIHISSNVLIFILTIPPLIEVIKRQGIMININPS